MGSKQQKRRRKASPDSGMYGCSPEGPGMGAEGPVAGYGTESSVEKASLMEEIVERGNLFRALEKVEKNGGAPGVDGMKAEELRAYLVDHWLRIKKELLSGTYKPLPVLRKQIPKPGGGFRNLGIPIVLDRFIQQAMLQVLQKKWDQEFSESSFGFRPKRSAHQAVRRAQRYIKEGKRWVVDIDLEKFFDRVNHDKLMGLVAKRIEDKRILILIRGYLNSGVMDCGLCVPTKEGTPQGGPLSPLLSNLMLDVLDKELEERGHCFVRYADDCNVYVGSKQAGERVMISLRKFLEGRLKLKVNEQKSAVARPWKRKFLGFTVTYRQGIRCKVSPEAVKRFKYTVRQLTRRTRGVCLRRMVKELSFYLKGWIGYFGIAEVKKVFHELDKWIRRRLRAMLWKQWKRRAYRELCKRGVSKRLAWNTFKSAHGPWRLSHSPGVEIALPVSFFEKLGLPQLRCLT